MVLLALVLLEAAAIALLGLLVAGLLRSHAEILRQLHHLGAGREDLTGRRPPSASAPSVAGITGIAGITGRSPDGEAIRVALDRPGQRTLLLFLSSGCGSCQPLWDGLRAGEHGRALPSVRVAVVARDADEESPSLLAGLGPREVPVILSSEAWGEFDVPGSPYVVLVDGTAGSVLGSGVASSWAQLGSLVGQHLGDLEPRSVDAQLLAAGIGPGHPSLHPQPGSWSRPDA
ncbi:MAG: hypothetical protein NVS1B12_15570 [Acidimicrobiales bacterium]